MAGTFHTINALWAHALVDELVRGGVRHVVISPGSRSTPLVLACAAHPDLVDHSVIDERSAAFVALGMAKSLNAPVAMVCTSGTAAANWLPAIREADASHVPLLALTADRPARLRDSGAPQMMDQIHLYGTAVRQCVTLPDPTADERAFRALRAAIADAVQRSTGVHPGPVHINIPFDKPLEPVAGVPPHAVVPETLLRDGGESVHGRSDGRGFTEWLHPRVSVDDAVLDVLEHRLRDARRVLLLAGPDRPDPTLQAAVHRLCRATGFPVSAEAASNLRLRHEPVQGLLAATDLLLRTPSTRALFDGALLLRFGGTATTAVAQRCCADHTGAQIRIARFGERMDPDATLHTVVHADPALLLHALAGRFERHPASRLDVRWRAALLRADADARAALGIAVRTLPWNQEAALYTALGEALRDGDALVLSSSMPVRDAEAFLTGVAADVDVYVNRGVNGIDGMTSTAVGVARARGGPVLLVTGDIAFLHDIGGLLWRGGRIDLAIVVVNNDGGGIFEMLPVREFDPVYEKHFVTPHGLDLSRAAALYGCAHVTAGNAAEFNDALAAWRGRGGVTVIEHRTTLREGRSTRTALFDSVSAALDARSHDGTGAAADPGHGRMPEDEHPRHTADPGFDEHPLNGSDGRAASRLPILTPRRLAGRTSVPDALLLHGFTRSGAMWMDVAEGMDRGVLVTDLPGHGMGPAPDRLRNPGAWTLDAAACAVIELASHCEEPPHLAGYSMGGRVALRAALLAPERFRSLTLVSASPGIESDTDRELRRAADDALADRIEREGLERFIDEWTQHPLFAEGPPIHPGRRLRDRAERMRGTAAGLAASLRGMGQGAQPPQWEHLEALRLPLLLLAGGRDRAYLDIAQRMRARLPRSVLHVVADAGHDIPTTHPLELRELCQAFWRHCERADTHSTVSTPDLSSSL